MPVTVLFIYTAVMLNTCQIASQCPNVKGEDMLLLRWFHVEQALFIANTVGVSAFLMIKIMMSRLQTSIRFSMQDEKMKRLTDCLSRHVWDSYTMQWALNNLAISFYVYSLPVSEDDKRQRARLFINLVAGFIQVFTLVWLFCFRILPDKK